MPTYKLTYFNFNAVAEPIRWLFKVAGVDFEDERIEREDWPNVKDSGRFPGKQMPILDIDGTVYTQSNAILRYLAKKYGFLADDDILNLRVDQAGDIISDARLTFRPYFIEQDPEKKAEAKKQLLEVSCPVILKQLNDIVTSTSGDFIAGSKLTWGDLTVVNAFIIWQSVDPNILDSYPALKKQKDAVLAVPAIKHWVEVRPKVWL